MLFYIVFTSCLCCFFDYNSLSIYCQVRFFRFLSASCMFSTLSTVPFAVFSPFSYSFLLSFSSIAPDLLYFFKFSPIYLDFYRVYVIIQQNTIHSYHHRCIANLRKATCFLLFYSFPLTLSLYFLFK